MSKTLSLQTLTLLGESNSTPSVFQLNELRAEEWRSPLPTGSQTPKNTDFNGNNGLTILWLIERTSNEVAGFLKRMHILAQAACQENCSINESSLLHREYAILLNEIEHYAQTASFSSIKLANGQIDHITIQLFTYYITPALVDIPLVNLTITGLGIANTSLTNAKEAQLACQKLRAATEKVLLLKRRLAENKVMIEKALER